MALTTERLLDYLVGVPEIDLFEVPVKAGQTIYAGAALELNGGYLENVAGAGTFAGFAMETSVAVGGESDGARKIRVKVQGGVILDITSETAAQSDVGASASVVEATDENTFRIERASTITGTAIGKVMYVVSTTRAAVSFKGAMVA